MTYAGNFTPPRTGSIMNHKSLPPLILAVLAIQITAVVCSAGESRRSIEQHGITWTFERAVPCGQFITGDWWVVGPVTITAITPAPGPAEERTKGKTKTRFGEQALNNKDLRMRHGSAIIASCGPKQGYDSRHPAYDPSLSVRLPLLLKPNHSLISTISNETLPGERFAASYLAMGEDVSVALKAAAVLTCLAEPPPDGVFRPAYVGTGARVFHRAEDIHWDRLPRLAPPASCPSFDAFAGYFQRPWLEHLSNWTQQYLNPCENQPNYGREHVRLTSAASLMLMLDVPQEKKRKLLIGFLQYGIDLSGCAKHGGSWNMGGGHSSGRKWPILFASIVLNDPALYDLPETALFSEDTQTYFGPGYFGQTALFQQVIHHGPRLPYEEYKPEDLKDRWDKTSEGYRSINLRAWPGTALAAYLMSASKAWGHDAFFANVERWMDPNDPYRQARSVPRPEHETTVYDPFIADMWKAYRGKIPKPEMSGKSRKWVWEGEAGKMVPNLVPAGFRP